MNAAAAALASWQVRPWLLLALLATAAVYARGWQAAHPQMPQRFGVAQLGAFLAGLGAVALAAASPLDAFAGLLLQVHMAQHLLLTMVAPPLLWLGAPAVPLLRGLPERWSKSALGPFLAWPALQRGLRALAYPPVAWLGFVMTFVLWHLPGPYQLALRSPGWHQAEHAAFLVTGLLFWWPVVQPWPSRSAWPRWTMVPYLILADAVNTAISALFIFSERVLYPTYAAAPRLFGTTPLDDQATAGALMWVPGSVAFLLPVVLIVVGLLNRRDPSVPDHPLSLPSSPGPFAAARAGMEQAARRHHGALRNRFDLLRLPAIGALLRWRYGRRTLQLGMLALAGAIVLDGFLGPQMAPMNLAGVLPWTYWRALAVGALLVAGNAVCLACPFMLPRELAKRLFPARRAWPRWLRAKWLGAALLVAYLWAYEVFAPWDSPWWTAVIVVAYFAAAFAVDALFRGAAFCKYVCPIGQFQFINSLAAPLTVHVRTEETCRTCTTHDCIRGNARQRGCELDLFLPEKHGNLDCTFCLDCVAACPHDNIGILAAAPARELARDPRRASVGRLADRPDLAALALIVVFAAFSTAAAMVEPVVRWSAAAAGRLGLGSAHVFVAVAMLLALVALPALTAGAVAWTARQLAGTTTPLRALICRYSPALIPLGLSMWTAHFLFHFWTGAPALHPVLQRVASELGSTLLGSPAWAASAPMRPAGDLTGVELLLLDAGLLGSVYALWRIAVHEYGRRARALAVVAPWAALAVTLWAAGLWIAFQPMAMRGMIH